jgi:hypothetical protein
LGFRIKCVDGLPIESTYRHFEEVLNSLSSIVLAICVSLYTDYAEFNFSRIAEFERVFDIRLLLRLNEAECDDIDVGLPVGICVVKASRGRLTDDDETVCVCIERQASEFPEHARRLSPCNNWIDIRKIELARLRRVSSSAIRLDGLRCWMRR